MLLHQATPDVSATPVLHSGLHLIVSMLPLLHFIQPMETWESRGVKCHVLLYGFFCFHIDVMFPEYECRLPHDPENVGLWIVFCIHYTLCLCFQTLLIALKEAMDYPQNRKWLSIDWRCTSFKLILLCSSQDVYLLLPCLPLPPSTPPPSFTWSCNLMSVRLAPGQTGLMFNLAQRSCVMVATELEVMVILESRTSGTHCTC